MKKQLIGLALILFLTTTANNVKAQKLFMKLEGNKSGTIKDDDMPGKFNGMVELTGYQFESSMPKDPGSGMASGRRIKSPLLITKNYSKASVQLFSALVTNEIFNAITIQVYKKNNTGQEIHEQTIKLTNATVTSFKQGTEHSKEVGGDNSPKDEIRFSYQKMEITWIKGNVVAED
jgi:type VI secretion system secreted protein Hcp